MSELMVARDARNKNEVTIELGDGTHVIARKEDMTLLVFEGRVPMPMLAAVQKMIELPDATPVERIEALGDGGKDLVRVLREHACKVVLKPTLTMDDDGEPDHLPVTYLDVNKLMLIWQATAVVPQVGAAAAARFRPRVAADDAPAVSAGTDVQPTAESVAVPRPVEFVGQ